MGFRYTNINHFQFTRDWGAFARRAGGDAGPALLLDLDFREPNQQSFPASATGIFAGRTADEIWLCDEASGNLVGEVASNALVPAGTPRHDLTATGFYNGTNCHYKDCIGLGGNGVFAHASSSFGDVDGSTSVAVLMVVRHYETIVQKYFFSKGITGARYRANLLTDGTVRLDISDGVGSNTNYSAAGFITNSWQAILMYVDRNTGKLGTLGTAAAAAAETTITEGSLSNAEYFTIGDTDAPNLMVAYTAVFTGTDAEGITQAELDTWWTHAKQYTSPTLTLSRTSDASPEVSYESGFGIRVAHFGAEEFAHQYKSGFTHPSKLGAFGDISKTNEVVRSQEFDNANWIKNTTTVTANDAEAPDGSYTADRLTVNGGEVRSRQVFATTASKVYTFSVFAKRGGGSDQTFDMQLYDDTGAADILRVTKTATSEWQRFTISAVVPNISTRVYLRGYSGAGENVLFWGAQCEEGELTAYIPTTSAATARANNKMSLTNTGYWDEALGEWEAVWIPYTDKQSSVQYLFYVKNAADSKNLLFHRISTAGAVTHLHYDDTPVIIQNINVVEPADWAAQENTTRSRWDSQNDLPEYAVNADVYANAVRAAGSATTWNTTGGSDTLYIFGNSTGTVPLTGTLARFRVWAGPRAE